MTTSEATGKRLERATRRAFRRSLHVFAVNAGSCNGCEGERSALLGPPYGLARYGIAFVDSPLHADMLLVTGPVTGPLRQHLLAAYQALPDPKLVAAVGACACTGGLFRGSYALDDPLDALIPVDVYIPGCPPSPRALLHGLLLAVGRGEARRGKGIVKR